jgi:hypothetical protein
MHNRGKTFEAINRGGMAKRNELAALAVAHSWLRAGGRQR